jgi:hypothetical protein
MSHGPNDSFDPPGPFCAGDDGFVCDLRLKQLNIPGKPGHAARGSPQVQRGFNLSAAA